MLLVALLLVALCVGLVVGLGVFQVQERVDRAYLVWSADIVQKYDLGTLGEEQIRESLFPGSTRPHSSQFQPFQTYFIYAARPGTSPAEHEHPSLLSPPLLQAVRAFEEALAARPDFRTFCVIDHADPQDPCDETSYEPSFLGSLYAGVDLASQSAIDSRSRTIAQSAAQRVLLDTSFSATNLRSTFGRSLVTFAGPLEGFGDVFTDRVAQQVAFVRFLHGLDGLVRAHSSSESGLEILVANRLVQQKEIELLAERDIALAVVSGAVVLGYVAVHLRSLLLAAYGMVQTLLAFPVAFFFYRVVGQVAAYSTIHNLAVFIILGVAADDLFVFTDAWRQSAKFPYTRADPQRRMALTYRRATKAMLVTSFTTAAAFFVTGFSDIVPIQAFGFLSALLILANYALVVTMYPAVLALYTKYRCAQRC